MIAVLGDLTGAAVAELATWVLIRGTLLVAIAWGLTRAAHARGAQIGHLVWGGLMIGLVVLPAFGLFAGGPRVAPGVVPASWWEAPVAAAPEIRPDARGARTPTAPTPIQVDLPEWTPPGAPPPSSLDAVIMLATRVWAVGLVVLVLRLFLRQLSLATLARRSRRWPGDGVPALVERVRRELGIRRRVRVLEVPELSVPACWGSFRPIVGLPPSARDLNPSELRAAVVHELAHVRRWDYVVLWFGELACALYWPNPAVWWAARQALAESETACDRTVLTHGTAQHDYAALLVRAASRSRGGSFRPRAALSMARGPDLRERVAGVLRFCPTSPVSRRALARLGVAAVAICAAVTVVGFGSDRAGRHEAALAGLTAAEPRHRASAARDLGDLRARDAVSALAVRLRDPAPRVRGAAAHALAETGSRFATRPLMNALDDPDSRVREAVILALGRTRDSRAYYDLEELTGSADRRVRLAATWAIGEIKCEPAMARLSYLLRRSSDDKTRLAAARGLRGAPAELARAALEAALADPAASVRAAAVESLELIS